MQALRKVLQGHERERERASWFGWRLEQERLAKCGRKRASRYEADVRKAQLLCGDFRGSGTVVIDLSFDAQTESDTLTLIHSHYGQAERQEQHFGERSSEMARSYERNCHA